VSGSTPTVAVTGMNARPDNPAPGVAVARCLRAAGRELRILGMGYDAIDPGLYLRQYCDTGYLLPYPSSGEEALFARIASIHEDDPIDALVPCLDAELLSMIRLADQLQEIGIRTFLPSEEQLKLRNKDRLPDLARIAGVRCPDIRTVSQAAFFFQCQTEGWRYPLMVKGLFYDAQIVYGAEEGVAAFQRIAAEWGYPVLVQRHVAGDEYNLTALGDGAGEMLGAVMMKKRALTAKGKAWAGVCTLDDRLHDAARALVSALRWRGPLEVEVIRDASGDYHLIEINPRFPAWIYLSHGAGRNLPAALLELVLGREPAGFPEPKVGTMFVRYAEEVIVPLAAFESVVVSGMTLP
jgi:carbamoyl-phosphate synthase large subunit